MDMNKRIKLLPLKSDTVFRLFFADERNTSSLTGFLQSVLDLPKDDYNEIEIADPHLLREHRDDKLSIIDVKLRTKSRKTIHIEIQLKVTAELKNRLIYYVAKLITEQMSKGGKFDEINRVISIIITDEKLISDSSCYHHRFVLADVDIGVELSDLIEFHTIELSKLPSDTDGTPLCNWAKLINADTLEELSMLATKNPELEQAVEKLRELSENKEVRELYERRLREELDHGMWMRHAETVGMAKGMEKGMEKASIDIARNLLGIQLSHDQIVELTGLTRQQVESL
jgi:predicted transposase/invertase (TIGR01784 family)